PVVQPAFIAPATHGIAAALADHQPLQQIPRGLLRQAVTLLVLPQLFLDGFEQRRLDDRRHRNAGPLLRRGAAVTDWPARLFTAVALRPLLRPARADPPLAVAGASLGGGIAENAPDGAAVPARAAAWRHDALLPEPSRHLADAQALAGHPPEDV